MKCLNANSFLIHFNLEKGLSPLATQTGRVHNILRAISKLGNDITLEWINWIASYGFAKFSNYVENRSLKAHNSSNNLFPLMSLLSPCEKSFSKLMHCCLKFSLSYSATFYRSYKNMNLLVCCCNCSHFSLRDNIMTSKTVLKNLLGIHLQEFKGIYLGAHNQIEKPFLMQVWIEALHQDLSIAVWKLESRTHRGQSN